MSIYVMSDIHGEEDLFHKMLEQIHFSKSDTLYILGDVIDRGPDGIQILQEIRNTPNMIMLLGSHEYMMLQYYERTYSGLAIQSWNRYRNGHTASDFQKLSYSEQSAVLEFLRQLPSHITIDVGGISYYLVHGFPGDTIEEEVRIRPALHERNPIAGTRLIIGHTPVLNLIVRREEQQDFMNLLAQRGEHPQILFAEGFIDVDCGCSYCEPIKTLGCLRLDDFAEFYEYSRKNALTCLTKHIEKVSA